MSEQNLQNTFNSYNSSKSRLLYALVTSPLILQDLKAFLSLRYVYSIEFTTNLLTFWSWQVVLDVYSFMLLFFNALARPRGAGLKLLDILYKDGLVFFLVSHFNSLYLIKFTKSFSRQP